MSNIQGLGLGARGLPVVLECIERNIRKLGALRLFVRGSRFDVMLLDGNPPYLWVLCLLRWMWPFNCCQLVSVDILFVKPANRRQRIRARICRVLLKRVDHFIHYFKDLEGYSRYFGIELARSTYVPFKVNAWEQMPIAADLSCEGDYVFTGGRSLRDLETFAEAMRLVKHPGILLYHDPQSMQENGTRLALKNLPANVQAREDDGSNASWLEHIRGARLVVITTLPSSIRAIGISTYLVAMGLKKCVIITEGPSTRQILNDEALIVEAGSPEALAEAIDKAWKDENLRRRTALAGRKYAEKLGGAERLYGDVIAVCARVATGAV